MTSGINIIYCCFEHIQLLPYNGFQIGKKNISILKKTLSLWKQSSLFMKKHLLSLVLLCLSLATAFCQTNEQKALALVRDYLFCVLDDFNSYEPAAIQVEPLYNTPIFDRDCLDAAKLMKADRDLFRTYDEMAQKADHRRNMADFTEEGKKVYISASREYYENKIAAIEADISSCEHEKFIKLQSAKLNGKQQVGWEIAHNFRSKNEYGNSVLSSYTFLSDMSMKEVKAVYNNKDKKTHQAIVDIQTILDDSTTPAEYDELINKLKDAIKSYKEMLENLKNL